MWTYFGPPVRSISPVPSKGRKHSCQCNVLWKQINRISWDLPWSGLLYVYFTMRLLWVRFVLTTFRQVKNFDSICVLTTFRQVEIFRCSVIQFRKVVLLGNQLMTETMCYLMYVWQITYHSNYFIFDGLSTHYNMCGTPLYLAKSLNFHTSRKRYVIYAWWLTSCNS